jgi:predicted O-methyltransferase YrrM/septal ring factor EnvC (AmiA/AmiB activator)
MAVKGAIRSFPDELRTGDEGPRRATAVVVAGMHRSGTSALTRIVNLLGFDLPKTLYAARPDNPLGYWEPLPVVEAHDRFLAEVGSSFDDVFPLADGLLSSGVARALEDQLVEILEGEFAGSPNFVVKDPRICRLVPVWTAALERFGADPHFVLTLRNPLEVAASLKVRNEYSVTKSLLLWLRHVLEAERHTRGWPRSFVTYDGLLRDWRGTVDRVALDLALIWPRSSHVAHAEIEEFVSPRRRHHAFDPVELESRADVVDWVKRSYGALLIAAAGEPLAHETLDAVRKELDRADLVFGPLLAESSLALNAKNEALVKQGSARESAEAQLAEREEALTALESELVMSRGEVERFSSELAVRDGTLKVRETSLEQARAELERVSSELAAHTEASAVQESQLEESRSEVARRTAELATASDILAARESELREARAELERVSSELAANREASAGQESQLEESRSEVARRTAELAAASDTLAARESELREGRAELQRLSSELAARDGTLEARESSLEQARAELERVSSELAANREASAGQESQLEESRSEVARRTAELAAASDTLAARESELDGLRGQLERAEKRRELSIAGLTRQIEASRSSVAGLRQEVIHAAADLAERDGSIAEHEMTVASLRENVDRLTDDLVSRDAVIGELDEGIAAARRELESSRTELDVTAAEARHLATGLQAKQADVEAHAEKIASLGAIIEEQAGQIEQQARELVAQSELVEDLSRRWWRRGSPRQRGAPNMPKRQQGGVTTGQSADPTRRGLRGRWRSFSQLGSWLLRPTSGGIQNLRTYRELRRTGAFDARYYLSRYVDVAEAGLDPLMHYVEHGVLEGRDPNISFNTARYLYEHPHLAEIRMNPLLHFVRRQADLERTSSAEIIGLLDAGEAGTSASSSALTDSNRRQAPMSAGSIGPDTIGLTEAAHEPAADLPLALSPAILSAPSRRTMSSIAAGTQAMGKAARAAERRMERGHDHSDFIILLARQRSGTNALRSVLNTHDDLFCLTEIFSVIDKDSEDPAVREINFFNFAAKNGSEVRQPDGSPDHRQLFLDYLEYIRCFSPKKYTVLDMKYNTTHLLSEPWASNFTSPLLFDLIIEHGIKVLNVTRKNYLRYVLSNEKALRSGRWHTWPNAAEYDDLPVDLDVDALLSELETCRTEDAAIQHRFRDYSSYFAWEYADLFAHGGSAVAPEFLAAFSSFVDVPDAFSAKPEFTKQSSLPLVGSIENFDEIERALRDTPYAACLDDEPDYRDAAAAEAPDAPARAAGVRQPRRHNSEVDWDAVIGCQPDAFSDGLYEKIPAWVTGSLSHEDARFLFRQALSCAPDVAIEIGTASGYSTALLVHALNFARAAGMTSSDWEVVTYDIDPNLYFDRTKRVGDAAREILDVELLARIRFRNPATAVDVRKDHALDSIPFLFLDASHAHPWPTLDLLATLECLSPGAVVVLHDINLPVLHPEHQAWGVKYVFDALNIEREVPASSVPNIGAIRIPIDKQPLRVQLLEVLARSTWDVDVSDDVLSAYGVA